MAKRLKIELQEWVYEAWARNENRRQNASGVFTNIPQFKFASRALKIHILNEGKKQMAKNIKHNKNLPPMAIDMMTLKLIPMPKNAK